MPNTNGRGPQRAALYRRVSGDEQAKKGYSLSDQRDEQLAYCALENLEVMRELEDAGYSGKFLERPDLDELRDLVATGGADVMVMSKRDRLARGLYAGYLKNEFKRHGVELMALDSRTEDTPYGDLLENTLDNFSEFERFMIADRMRRGKRSKSKQGKLVACPQPDYGFRYNEARDGYEVDELRMALIRRIFRMVGVEGLSLNAVARMLEAEGKPAPRGGRTWNRPTLRKFVLSDVYLRHSYEEVTKIVASDVAATLDRSAHYGISWYGKQRHTHSREVRVKDGKKTYPRVKKSVDAPREEWIGVPVPDTGIPKSGCSRPGRSSRKTRRSQTVAGASGSLPGVCCVVLLAKVQWPRTSLRRGRRATIAVAGGIGWESTPARRGRTSGRRRLRRRTGSSSRASSRTRSGFGAGWTRCWTERGCWPRGVRMRRRRFGSRSSPNSRPKTNGYSTST
jgi:DNA invertase Pin-like site-specific DNA recombinase